MVSLLVCTNTCIGICITTDSGAGREGKREKNCTTDTQRHGGVEQQQP